MGWCFENVSINRLDFALKIEISCIYLYKMLLDIRCTDVFGEDFSKVPIHFRWEAVSVAWSTQVGTRPTTTIGTQVPSKKHKRTGDTPPLARN